MNASAPCRLRRRIRVLTSLFMLGLAVSGVTAIPLVKELDWVIAALGLTEQTSTTATPAVAGWLLKVREGLAATQAAHPHLFYGTDWLAFAHLVLAIAFVGAWRDPLRNRWLYDFGLIACGLVIPWALTFGAIRGIPLWWQLMDCSVGVLGAIPLWLCRRWVKTLQAAERPCDGHRVDENPS